MSVFFQNRDAQTPLEDSMRKGLIPTHINHMTELYEHEVENIAMGIEWTKKTRKDHKDYLVWLEVHKHMLGDVWGWAGEVRQKELANPDFEMPYNIRPELKRLCDDFNYWLDNETFPERRLIARLHERLLTIHPFNDGNGRWSRILINMICEKEGFEIPTWGASIKDDKDRRNRYISAVLKARQEDNVSDLIEIMYFF